MPEFFVTALKDFFGYELIGVPVWRYAAAFLALAASFYIKRVLVTVVGVHLKALVTRTRFRLDDVVLQALARPLSWAAVILGIYVALEFLRLSRFEGLISAGLKVAVTALATVFALRLIDGLGNYLKPQVEDTGTKLDDAIMPAIQTAAKVFIIIVAALWLVDNLGYNVKTILAGLGIGGLALALAGQETLSNWFGAITIFADRPFAAGDRVQMAGFDGMIEQVGLRSTRLRTLEGTLVTIPNSTVADSEINNISRWPGRRVYTTIGVTYSAGPGGMQKALEIVREVLAENDGVREDFIVNFEEFGDSSLDIRVLYWTKTVDYAEFLSIREEVNLEIMRRFAAEGIEIAFPTQTVHLVREEREVP